MTRALAFCRLRSWPDKSWKWLQKSGFFNWWNDRFIGQAHQASDDELWNWNSMEEGGSRKQVTKIKVIVFKSCILVRLNVPVAVRLLKLSIVEPTPRCLLIDIVLQNLFVFGWWIVELKFHGGGRIRKTGYNNKITVFKSCVLVNIAKCTSFYKITEVKYCWMKKWYQEKGVIIHSDLNILLWKRCLRLPII